jgi:hypothetical protein
MTILISLLEQMVDHPIVLEPPLVQLLGVLLEEQRLLDLLGLGLAEF